MKLIDAYYRSVHALRRHGIDTPEYDAAVLIHHILGVPRHAFYSNRDRRICLREAYAIRRAVRQRSKHKPVAYITGYRDFYRDRIRVSPGTLIPRSDTEHLIYAVENLGRTFDNVLEVGTGTGAVSISLARVFPEAQITGFDIDIATAQENVRSLGITNVALSRTDIFSVPDGFEPERKYDLIVSNPPYLSDEDMAKLPDEVRLYEPRTALYGGADGLDFYRKIIALSGTLLADDGYVVFEVDYKWKEVLSLAEAGGFGFNKIERDYGQLERVLIIKK